MDKLAQLLSQGGDSRIVVDGETGLNRYLASPYPREMVSYASTTANDISQPAYDFLLSRYGGIIAGQPADGAPYAAILNDLRSQLMDIYKLSANTTVAFAPSGTDLEYLALALASRTINQPIHNVLLGADEVGSGCILSAAGKFFANETALVSNVIKGSDVTGLPPIDISELPVRDDNGNAYDSKTITDFLSREIDQALADGKKPLIHVVHGSKTGLILPLMDDIDRLISAYGNDITFVVDACQARITAASVNAYLSRNMLVMMTGSKFMGGPPFNGFMLCPAIIAEQALRIPAGFADIFRRAEMPNIWEGRDILPDSANVGLALRLAASLFELERFAKLPSESVTPIIKAFQSMSSVIIKAMGGHGIDPYSKGQEYLASEYPLETGTMATFDLNADDDVAPITFDQAVQRHRDMAQFGARIGQPVRCRRCGEDYRGTMRLALSMPLICTLVELSPAELDARLADDARAIIDAYRRTSPSPAAQPEFA